MIVLGNIRQRQQRDLQEMTAPAGDVLAADWSEARESNPIEAYNRFADLDIAQNGYTAWAMSETAGVGLDPSWQEPTTPELSQEQAQARVDAAGLTGHLEIPAAGMRAGALDILIERKKTELGRQSVWNRAPGGVGLAVARLGTALAASMTDPVNIGLGFLPVVSGARYASWLASKSTALGRVGVRAGVGAIEGAAGAAVVEPLILLSKTRDQSEYGLLDSFMNVTVGAFMGAGLHAGGGALGDLLARRAGDGGEGGGTTSPRRPSTPMERALSLMPLEARETVAAQGLGAVVEGGSPQPGAVLDALAKDDSRVARALAKAQRAAAAAAAPEDPRVTFWTEEVKRLRSQAVEPAKSESLFSFVRRQGGVQPGDMEGLEVRGLLRDARVPPGFYNAAGKNADDLALAAWEAGYIGTPGGERPGLQEFYDALDREARGARVYPEGRAGEFSDARRYRDSVEQALADVGLSLNDDPAQVGAALADLQRQAEADAVSAAPTHATEADAPDYLESSRQADEIARRPLASQEERLRVLESLAADADAERVDLEAAGLLDAESLAALRAADEAVSDAASWGKAAREGALCMARSA